MPTCPAAEVGVRSLAAELEARKLSHVNCRLGGDGETQRELSKSNICLTFSKKATETTRLRMRSVPISAPGSSQCNTVVRAWERGLGILGDRTSTVRCCLASEVEGQLERTPIVAWEIVT